MSSEADGKTTCSIEGCDKKHQAKGWCKMHYTRWLRHGNPLTRRSPVRKERPAYRTAHQRVVTARGKASEYLCVGCGGSASQWSYNKSDPNEVVGVAADGVTVCAYSTSPDYYDPMCPPCHVRRDSRVTEGCAVPGCPHKHKAKGMCRKHYLREWQREYRRRKAER